MHSVPHEDHYWNNSHDLGVQVVSETLSNKRYHVLKKYMHLTDNQNLLSGDKVAKVSPLYSVLNDNLVQFGDWHSDLSVDKSTVPYYGRHGIQLFLIVVNVSVVAAWRLHCSIATHKTDHLTLLCEITMCLLKTELNEPRRRHRTTYALTTSDIT